MLLSYVIASLVALTIVPASAAPGARRGLAIVAPSEARTIVDDSGAVIISLSPVPPLEEGDRIVLRVDEQIVILPSGLTKFTLTGVPRGPHTLEALIVDADGTPVAAADGVSFEMAALVWI